MKKNELTLPTVQERLAYAWAVTMSVTHRTPTVSDRTLNRCRDAANQLSLAEALQYLSEVPALAA